MGRSKLSERGLKTSYNLRCFLCRVCGLEKGHLAPILVYVISKRGHYICTCLLATIFALWKAVKASLLKLQPHLANLLFYRHPAHAFPPFQDEFIKLVTHLQNKNCEYLIGGDFNCNLLKYHEQSNVTNFVDSLASCGCISLINKPTRFSNNCTPSLLDHVYTNICDEKKIMLELLYMIFLIICQFL